MRKSGTVWHTVDTVERRLRSQRDAEARQQRADEPDDQRRGTALQRPGLQLVAHQRDLLERRVQHRLLGSGVAVENEAQDRHKHHEQRKQREEAVVGDERGEVAALVVAELLDDGHGHGEGWVPTLEAVKGLGGSEDVHRFT